MIVFSSIEDATKARLDSPSSESRCTEYQHSDPNDSVYYYEPEQQQHCQLTRLLPRIISTAPTSCRSSSALELVEQFKTSKQFMLLEQTVVCSSQLIHKTYDKFDLDTLEGQAICQKYLDCIERMAGEYHAATVSREYRDTFSQAYRVLYKEGRLNYLTEILDSAQEGFPYLWVNGDKFQFSQLVLNHGSALMTSFFKLQHFLRMTYSRVTQDHPAAPHTLASKCLLVQQITTYLEDFDQAWALFERTYVLQLMQIEVKARSLVVRAINAEKHLEEIQRKEKTRGRVSLNTSEQYLSARNSLCILLSQLNQAANYYGKGRDDLDHQILCETDAVLRKISKEQSRAIRILGQSIRTSFDNLRELLRRYALNIDTVDPQLKNNQDLVDALLNYEKCWEKGLAYFMDPEKKRFLLHFSGIVEGLAEKYPTFREQIECSDADIFLIIPCVLILRSLDNDDRLISRYFLPSLNQIDTKIFRTYFELQKHFFEWKKECSQTHKYMHYNILEGMIVGGCVGESEYCAQQKVKYEKFKILVDKILHKIKLLGMELHRGNPAEWNYFMEICLAGANAMCS